MWITFDKLLVVYGSEEMKFTYQLPFLMPPFGGLIQQLLLYLNLKFLLIQVININCNGIKLQNTVLPCLICCFPGLRIHRNALLI